MKMVYNSLEELTGGCASSALKSCVRGVLAANKYIRWELLSCSDDGDLWRSQVVHPVKGSDLVHYLALVAGPFGARGYMTVREADVVPGVRNTV